MRLRNVILERLSSLQLKPRSVASRRLWGSVFSYGVNLDLEFDHSSARMHMGIEVHTTRYLASPLW